MSIASVAYCYNELVTCALAALVVVTLTRWFEFGVGGGGGV